MYVISASNHEAGVILVVTICVARESIPGSELDIRRLQNRALAHVINVTSVPGATLLFTNAAKQ